MRPLVAALAVACGAACAADGLVVDVPDGQTLVVQRADGTRASVRLAGIEAPERCQPWGAEAKAALRDAALGQPVTLRGSGALVQASVDGQDLSRKMVEDGHAWSTRTKFDRGPLVREERVAHSLARGLHGEPGAMRPADWRRRHGACR